MHFSIIIPTLNEEQNIKACLLPLQNLRGECELIVVDGGSSDDTRNLAKPLADKIISTKRSRAFQMNAGAKQAKGKMLIFLHADTLLPEDALERIKTALDNRKRWGRFDIYLTGQHPMLKVIATLMNWRSRLTGIATGDQVIFVEKALFEIVGGYPNIPLMEDVALCKKLKTNGSSVCLNSKVTSSGRRWEKFGIWKTLLLMWYLRLRYYFGADPEDLAYLYKRGQFWKT